MVSKGRQAKRRAPRDTRTLPPVVLYVEGGAPGDLRQEGRRGLGQLLSQLGLRQQPRIRFCGGRDEAFKTFNDRPADEPAILLVDAEEVPAAGVGTRTRNPWAHLRKRDSGWPIATGVKSDEAFLMCVTMETWCLADPASVRAHLNLTPRKHPVPPDLEQRSKDWVEKELESLTEKRWQRKTGKSLSIEFLGVLRATEVERHCTEFKALCEQLRELCR